MSNSVNQSSTNFYNSCEITLSPPSFLTRLFPRQFLQECSHHSPLGKHLWDPDITNEVRYGGSKNVRTRIFPKQPLKLCSSCLEKILAKSFDEFKGRMVLVEPRKGTLQYHFYSIEFMPRAAYTKEDQKATARLLPPEDTQCVNCKISAPITWISENALGKWGGYYDPSKKKQAESQLFINVLNASQKYLCKKCAIKELMSAIQRNNIKLYNINAPYNSEGAYLFFLE